MAHDRRDRVSRIHHAALARPREERAAFLKKACDGDEPLRQELESLLAFESASTGFLETHAAQIVVGAFGEASDRARMVGRQLGPYTVLEPLGAGGMGEVYRARDSKLKRDVAIKILPPQFMADAERRKRFAREARIVAALNHPHIGAIYGLEEADGVTALVLELVEGPTLAAYLERGPLPIGEALAIAKQVAEALDAAHDKGIVHRDLKPANIVLQPAANAAGVPSGDMRAKVLDFGLAKTTAIGLVGDLTVPPSDSLDGTADGRILGTPAYMSPEQARGQAVDKRTDIWAFGCVLFEMLAGRPAFAGDTLSETFVRILERQPDWAALPTHTSPAIRTLLQRCLRKDPRKRLHDVADALIELDESDPAAGSSTSGPVIQAPVAAPHRKREWLGWLMAGVLGVVAAVVYFRAAPPAVGPFEFPIGPPDNTFFQTGGPSLGFEISPDGQQLAVVANSLGGFALWVRPIAAPTWRQLPGTQGATGPFWSADSQSLGFFSDGKLKAVKVSGGSPIVITDAPYTVQGDNHSGTWNRNDVIVFAVGVSGLQRVPAKGGEPTTVTTLSKGDTAHRWPSFLPDGEHFLFLAGGAGARELRVGSLGSAETTSLGPADSNARYASGYLLLVRTGRLMAQPFDTETRQLKGNPLVVADPVATVGAWQPGQFSVSATGVLGYSRLWRPTSQLTWRDRSGTILESIGKPGVYINLDLSRDERRLAVSQMTEQPGGESNVDIWTIDLERGGAAKRLTDDAAREFDPAWSPDGTQIAFNSNRIDAKFTLWTRPSSGSGRDTLLVQEGGTISAPDWSRDKPVMLYSQLSGSTGSDLWTLPFSGDREPVVYLNTRPNESRGTFSPDSQWVAYESDSSGRTEIYVSPFPVADEQIPISHDGGRAPAWSDNGQELFFLTLDGKLMAARTEFTPTFKASVPVELFETAMVEPSTFSPYVVAKSGQRFLMPILAEAPGSMPITVLLNWPAKLPR